MPAYTFEALDADGSTRKGVIEADTAKSARGLLRAQSLVPMVVEAITAGNAAGANTPARGTTLWSSRVFGSTALAIWTRQIAGLVVSGLPLERALTSLSEESEDERQRQLVAALRAEVNGGTAFATALAQHPREFSPTYCAVVGAGEHSGNLGLVLERLADDLEQGQALKAQLVGAALYPAIVTLVAIAIVMFLLGYVVPQVAEVFAGSKRALPLLTVIMLGLGNFVRNQGWWLLFTIIFIVICARLAWASATFRERFDAAWLNLPVLGKLSRGYNAARFASTLAMLASAGVPILKALQAAADTVSNRAMRIDALDALVLVREGAPLAQALAQKKRFPGLLAMFARLGEQTGQLPVMLERASRQLGTEVQRRALQLATLLEPLLIVAMGLVVMLIVLAVLLPIIQLNQLVR
ncbi:type II secretion system inner membrane protein GspF [Candidatus Aalborgicola defluviihabitans]|jgi:general secretion pathway protein F|uniref:type II secretion system inner membrane protein GspF n=1 Tax=Candidatus Aalborgicola defluviihabitans TaxID=3386187 RepID=UPI001DCEBCDD|nr:type II secretion system inner membrane protein GspF [Burkholderiales bacterium]MBK6570463.1 type II secretion system inner membrane protein GspF [Burkholderiales bacterium]MBK7279461.1 type II secretion system inner membrane protein GspF [Burkholderiales bacterium]MBK7312844.1 type II secretion system inner membrane protein GspF [Burkholderiales bacterium]MBL0243657.1 type II secretion system inner membrane protein GspF [Rhodoferax sp.]